MSEPLDRAAAARYGKFVSAAYAMYGSDPADLQPAPAIPAGFTFIAWVQMSDFAFGKTTPAFYGFIAQDAADPKSFVLAIRGTEGAVEWWDNFHAVMTRFARVPTAGSVADGFVTIYDTLKVVTHPTSGLGLAAPLPGSFADQVAQVVRASAPPKLGAGPGSTDLSSASVVVTGHSLGGALCALYVMENTAKGAVHNPLICTFASPRVGDAAFVRAFNVLGLTSWRIANEPDMVPNLPPDVFGYRHVDALTLVDSTGKVKSTLGCAHSLDTYLALLDPTLAVGPDCAPQAQDQALKVSAGAVV